MRLTLTLTAALIGVALGGCSEEKGEGVTGYVECFAAPSCASTLECTTPSDTRACLPLGADEVECTGDLCDCWAERACGAGACIPTEDGFACLTAEGRPKALTAAYTIGVCPVTDDDTTLEMSLVFAGHGGTTVVGSDAIVGVDGPVESGLTAARFSFTQLPDPTYASGEPATANSRDDGSVIGLNLSPTALRFDATARADEQLVVFALDHSGSLIGEDFENGGVRLELATDLEDQRIAFFLSLANMLDPQVYTSVVSFLGTRPVIDIDDGGVSVPTRDRDVTLAGLMALEAGTHSTTPLAETLQAIRETIVAPRTDLQASVVLFTDGVETGDPTDPDGSRLDSEIAAYAAAGITVHVLELSASLSSGHDLNRDPKLAELACRSGGEYVFLEDPIAFTDPSFNLAGRLSLRQSGAWRLRVTAPELSGLSAGWSVIETLLNFDIGAGQQIDLSFRSRHDDTRLWVHRD